MSAYRVYANTLSSLEYLPYANLDKEMQIVLPFARDYDTSGKPMVGDFAAYFDKTNFNATAMQAIRDKAKFTAVKFFLSIGGRNSNYPFTVTAADKSTWIENATKSLTRILKEFGFDGLDIYYEHIHPNAESLFVDCIFDVLSNLRRAEVITLASITVSSRLNNKYHDLFMKNEKRFDYVVYQTHTEPSRISNVRDLDPVIARLHYRPESKILAGYSDLPSDWDKVAPPIFLGAVPQLLKKGISGFSKWIVTPSGHNPEA